MGTHHRRPSALVAALALGCSAEGLTGEQLCAEAATTVASRVYDCTADRDAANEAAEELEDLGCRVEDLDEEETAEAASELIGCLEALDAMDCDATERGMEEAEQWLGVDPGCPVMFGPGEYPDPVAGGQP